MVASHGSRVSEPCVGCVCVAGVQDSWGDEEAPPVMHAVLGGCATEDEVGSHMRLCLCGRWVMSKKKTLTSNRESFEVV